MKALRAPRATGFDTFHVWKSFAVNVPAEGTEARLLEQDANYKLFKDFLLPGQLSPAEIAKRPGMHRVWFDYLTRNPIAELQRPSDALLVRSRSKLDKVVYRINNAGSSSELDVITGPMHFVVFEDPGASR